MIQSTCDYLELPNVGKCQRNEKRKIWKNHFIIQLMPIQVAQKTQKVVKNDEIASKSTEKSDVFDNYEGKNFKL